MPPCRGAAGQLVSYGLHDGKWLPGTPSWSVSLEPAGWVLLEQQRATFNYAAMTTTVFALVLVSLRVDACSAAIRQSMR